MRKLLLVPLLIAAVACGGGEEDPPVERTFRWDASAGTTVTAAALLPGGEILVGLDGDAREVRFLSPAGGELSSSAVAVRAAQPLVVGEYAFFGDEAGGGPLYRIEPATRRVREMELENPRGLPLGSFLVDGRYGTAMHDEAQMLLPGNGLVQISNTAILTAIHPTPALRAVAHVRDDIYTFIDEAGELGGWRKGDGDWTAFDLPVARIAGGDGFTVLGLEEAGQIELYLYDDPIRPLGHAFVHQLELAVAPAAQRLIVGVRDHPIDAPAAIEAPAPRTALVLDGAGKVLGSVETPAPITAVHIAPDGKRALVAHERGVIGLDVR